MRLSVEIAGRSYEVEVEESREALQSQEAPESRQSRASRPPRVTVRVGGIPFVVDLGWAAPDPGATPDSVTLERAGAPARTVTLLGRRERPRSPAAPLAGAGASGVRGEQTLSLLLGNAPVTAHIRRVRPGAHHAPGAPGHATPATGPCEARSVLPGVVRRILRPEGASVRRGEAILTVEAMKMENEIRAEIDGVISSIPVAEGQVINAGQLLAVIEP